MAASVGERDSRSSRQRGSTDTDERSGRSNADPMPGSVMLRGARPAIGVPPSMLAFRDYTQAQLCCALLREAVRSAISTAADASADVVGLN